MTDLAPPTPPTPGPLPPALPPDGAHYRLGALQRTAPVAMGFPAALAGMGAVSWLDGKAMRPGEILACLVATGLGAGLAALGNRGYGLEITPGEAVVHGIRLRRIRWADVRSVTVRSELGVRVVLLVEHSGRATRLRAPTGFLDRGFDAKVREITAYWLAHRAAPVTPR